MIAYCQNIHPTDTLREVTDSLTTYARAVKAAVSPSVPYPVGLRLSAHVAEELAQPEALTAFTEQLRAEAFFAWGINGFPYGAFHSTRVKTAVYDPDWSTRERLSYTCRLARILAALLPEGETGNLSTVPLGYRFAKGVEERRGLYTRQCIVAARFLEDLKRETGREICLAIEPEPDCLIETSAEFISWFEDELLREGREWLRFDNRKQPEKAEELLRRHIGICFDTCHFAVNFESPLEALGRLEAAGIRIGRIQLSAAVRAETAPEALAALAQFAEPVYLHQTRVRNARGRIAYYRDLPDALAAAPAGELRTHFHVPLSWEGDGTLGTTRNDLSDTFFAAVCAKAYPLEIETYTFDVLPPELKSGSVAEQIIRETQWAEASLARPKKTE